MSLIVARQMLERLDDQKQWAARLPMLKPLGKPHSKELLKICKDKFSILPLPMGNAFIKAIHPDLRGDFAEQWSSKNFDDLGLLLYTSSEDLKKCILRVAEIAGSTEIPISDKLCNKLARKMDKYELSIEYFENLYQSIHADIPNLIQLNLQVSFKHLINTNWSPLTPPHKASKHLRKIAAALDYFEEGDWNNLKHLMDFSSVMCLNCPELPVLLAAKQKYCLHQDLKVFSQTQTVRPPQRKM